MSGFRTRFAPSPTGYLHLGHAYSALKARDLALATNGAFLLRLEDLDLSRVRSEFELAIYEDLQWLGLQWPEPVLRQSDHTDRYAQALERLTELGVTYPCSCTRSAIRASLSAPHRDANASALPFGAPYPGTCRGRSMADMRRGDAVRLDLKRAIQRIGSVPLLFTETGPAHSGQHSVDPTALIASFGDVVLGRKDTGLAAYHLAVVVDDAFQKISHVVRGADLWEVTPLHRLLQSLLELPVPIWHHHQLVLDENGKRLAKRDAARALRMLRAEGATPSDIRQRLGI
ncbi:MAG: tRNA glutamyl-Q(34) synthetase GluQRS [Pseudomonadota bacterium]